MAREVDRPVAGHEVLVHARRGDVLEVVVHRVLGHARDPILRVLAHAVGVADVEVQPDARRVDPLDELQVLVEPLDQQLRLRLDQAGPRRASRPRSTHGISSS